MKGGLKAAIARGIADAPFADLIWCETSTPGIAQARRFAGAVRKVHPDQMLAQGRLALVKLGQAHGRARHEAHSK